MKNLFTSIIISFSVFSSALHGQVTLTWQDSTQTYANPVRVAQALPALVSGHEIYWPSAALFDRADVPLAELEAQRQSLLKKLNLIHQRFANEDRAMLSAIDQLSQVVSSWTLGKRSPIKIDLDLARIKPANNPLLSSGSYMLSAGPRGDSVFITGAVKRTVVAAHKPFEDISQYLTSEQRIQAANQDYIYLIQADGRVILAPSVYWNKQHQEVMPSSLLFVPFATSLFHPELEEINTLVISLAKNRVL